MKFSLILLISIFLSCQPKPELAKPATVSLSEQMVLAAAYHQQAAEVKALQIQAYKLGSMRLKQILLEKKHSKKLAVVVDIDETVLDNSPYQAKQVFTGESYPTGWDDWCKLEKAEPIAGAVDFLNEAVSQGVDVYYISNRRHHLLEATMNNLKKVGFPQVELSHIMLRGETSSKVERRAKLSETHEIVLLFGDNLGDFTDLFEKKPMTERNALVDSIQSDIASKFITLPNPLYGDWEGAIYNYNYGKSAEEKSADRKAALKQY